MSKKSPTKSPQFPKSAARPGPAPKRSKPPSKSRVNRFGDKPDEIVIKGGVIHLG